MCNLAKRFWQDEGGFIVSAEIVLIVTIGVLGMIVGLSSVASAVNNELNDLSSAFGAMDQSYWYAGTTKWGHSGVVGSAYADARDFCDCTTIVPTPPDVKWHSESPPPAVPIPPPTPLCPVPEKIVVPPCPPGPPAGCLPFAKPHPVPGKGPHLGHPPLPKRPVSPKKKK